MKTKFLIFLLLMMAISATNAQVKIGDNPTVINSNSILELESATKGFLPPRMALNSLSSVAPLTGTVPAGMLIYSIGGSVIDGYYYWNGTVWIRLESGSTNVVSKTASTTLTKSETIVLGSNDITLTLPVVTAADNGLEITVKNVGSHTNLLTIVGSASATIDGIADSKITKNMGQGFIATGGNWIIKGPKYLEHELLVDEYSSWTTVQEAIDFLNLHMTAPVVIKLAEEQFTITATITINLPFPIAIQGLSYGKSVLAAGSGLANSPMFICVTECDFKMLQFDASTLASYGTLAGEDGIRITGSGTYNEIKDCSFVGFYNTILVSTNAELWLFECDIFDANKNGLLIQSAVAGTVVKVSETDFVNCRRGVNMEKGQSATIQLASGGYFNGLSTDTAILYNPATFTTFTSMVIVGNSWNNIGAYIGGFDFTRADGRDAKAFIENNAGIADSKPSCFINVLNSATTKTLTTQNIWYKADWGANTAEKTCKLTISTNKITYQPVNRRNGVFTVSGDLSVNNSNQNISIGIVKNGVATTRYGETTLRVSTANQPFQFSFIAYIENIGPTDYFEIYYSNATSAGQVVTIQDIQWLMETK